MDKDLEARIRTRAYHIWENDPSPDGKADDHWEEARRQIEAEGAGDGGGDGAAAEPSDQSAERDRGARIAPDQQLQEMPGGGAEPASVSAPRTKQARAKS
ncbi:DUF2934 domain-containing protein [Paraburkholderia sp. MMS20-SJTR3]|uniref:DUF2934 domain-containing protein n=1 Tax=Paraburkholderia sejongensis TaxID=2886946 RepID=A0ABS8K017_9BURK|nr:DUF2934 domain-containing protein [Paraburkholderia sp. MMS20-SJTR3]MCC8395489.1 DUF2934 domain-containing protein [Paraburkholderia sp. MMS20-SJTR3]